MPQETKAIIDRSSDPLRGERGLVIEANNVDDATLLEAVEQAFHYRGDVTVTRCSDGAEIAGYVFNRSTAATRGEAMIQIIPTDGGDRVSITCDDIETIAFTGRDTAAGKSFDTWVKKFVEKKLAGQEASIHCDGSDEPG